MSEGSEGGSVGTAQGSEGQGVEGQSTEGQVTGQESKAAEQQFTEATEGETKEKSEKTETKEQEKHKFFQHFKDKKFEKDSDYFDHALNVLSENEGYITKNKEANKKMLEVLEQNPQIITYIQHLDKGMDAEEALVRSHEMDKIIERYNNIDEAPDDDKLKVAKSEKQKKYQERKQKKESFDNNLKESAKVMKDFVKAEKMDDVNAKMFYGKIDEAFKSLNQGQVTTELLSMLKKGLAFEVAVEEAKTEGEIKGKNEKIEAKKETEKPKGDNVPKIHSSRDIQDKEESIKEESWLVDVIERQEKKKIT